MNVKIPTCTRFDIQSRREFSPDLPMHVHLLYMKMRLLVY